MNNEVITTANKPEIAPTHPVTILTDGKMLDLVYWPNKLLKSPALEIEEFNPIELELLIKNMFTTMLHYKGTGLAAPQIGIKQKLFIWALNGKHGYMINPIITAHNYEKAVKEQCLSFPGLTVTTTRAAEITITWQDMTGEVFNGTYTDIPAMLFQHETEHLEGMSMISTLSSIKRDIVTRKMKKFIRIKKNVERSSA